MYIFRRKKTIFLKKLCFIIIILIILSILFTCTKHPTKGKNKGFWNHFQFANPIHNYTKVGFSTDDKLITAVNGGVFIFDDLDSTPEFISIPKMEVSDSKYKPALSNDFVAFTGGFKGRGPNITYFASYNNSVNNTISVKASDFGEQFEDYFFMSILDEDGKLGFGKFNSLNRFVGVIGESRTKGAYPKEPYVFFIDLELNEDNNPKIVNMGFLNIPEIFLVIGQQMNVLFNIVYQNNFYLVVYEWGGSRHHRIIINQDGSHECITTNYMIDQMYTYKDHLIGHFSNLSLHYSTNANDWTLLYGYMHPPLTYFSEIGDYLFTYLQSQVFCLEFDFNGNGECFKFPLGSLEDKKIFSIHKFRDDLVITTNDGIYYQNYDEVIRNKTQQSNQNRNNNSINLEGE